MRFQFLIITFVLFFSCNEKKCRKSVEPIPVTFKVERLETALKQATSSEKIEEILNNHPSFSEKFFDNNQYPSNKILAGKILKILQHPSMDTLYDESMEAFQDFDTFIIELQDAYGRLKTYYPSTKVPSKLTTTISGLHRDMIVTNDEIMIGLDYFVGKKATFRPINVPDYISKRFDRAHLASMIMRLVSGQFVKNGNKKTMLSEMIDHGKNYYLLSKIMPCTPMHILFGYTKEEWESINENEHIIWANFVENKLLYETSDFTKQKFIGERPNIYEIGDKCPGRIGTWIGWRIVKNYAEKTGISIEKVMSQSDHHMLFGQSGYKPRN